ncbi:hypothetical protein [Streptosporangium vulgare]|uniref:Aminoglycoside phosphotransferase n=1 Tax=Streptosporangium vulgare TaxID=46190 RepID=A0ABV5TBA0_9ACTN
MTALAMVAEFDDVVGWTADAVELLGERHAVPAARQGERSARLFATGRIAVRLVHAVSRPALQPMEET